MKSMEKYGPSLFDYEGPANLTYQQDQECIVFEGKFQARQLNSGSIAIGFSSTSRSPGTISIGTESGFELSLAGHFPDGWIVTTLGDILSGQPLSLFFGPSEHLFSSHYLRARLDGTPESGYDKARFLVSTLLLPESSDHEPQPIELETQGFRVLVKPLNDYLAMGERIRSVHLIEPTAHVLIESSNGERLPLQTYGEFMSELVYIFRLATGTGVEWYYGEAFDDSASQVVDRIHKGAIHGPFSNQWRFEYPNPDFAGLTSTQSTVKSEG